MKEELLFIGIIFLLSLIASVYYGGIKRFAAAVKEKKYQQATIELIILLAITAICVFIVKPFQTQTVALAVWPIWFISSV